MQCMQYPYNTRKISVGYKSKTYVGWTDCEKNNQLLMKNAVVIGIGNQIMGDDSIALHIIRALKELPKFSGQPVDFIEREDSGLSLLDMISDYDSIVVIDSIKTGKHPVGSVVEVPIEQFEKQAAWGNHYIGLGETIDLVKRLHLEVPDSILVLGIEIEDPYRIGMDLSEEIKLEFFNILINVKRRVDEILKDPMILA